MNYLSVLTVAGMLFTAAPVMAAEGGFVAQPSHWGSPQDRCEAGKMMLSNHIEAVTARHEEKDIRYHERLDRLNALAGEADQAGVDSTQLRSYIATLETLYAEFEADLDTIIAHWEEVLTYDCSTVTAEQYRAEREKGRAIRDELRADVKAIRDHVHNSVAPEAHDLRDAIHNEE